MIIKVRATQDMKKWLQESLDSTRVISDLLGYPTLIKLTVM